MKKILIYPGAFNPPHYGHVETIELALKNNSFDELWIIPSGKRDDKVITTTYEDRRGLGILFVGFLKTKINIPVKLVTDELDDTEGKLTREILGKIKSQPDIEVTQLIGIDGILHLYKKLIAMGVFETERYIVIQRTGYELPDDFTHGSNIVIEKEETGHDISSTQIRNMASVGDDNYKSLVPEEIATYISEHSLYQRHPSL
jgi:nicotinic acid mononucleotide adenylyltransferase